MQASTLRPGLLVSLKTSIRGNVIYRKRDIQADVVTPEGELKALWETERTIHDPVEHETAVAIRSKCRTMITSVCTSSSFGLLCPENREDTLAAAIKDAQELADNFNSLAKLTRIGVFVMAGRIAQDDVQAVKAIKSEVQDLISEMETGLKELDVSKVRDAAAKAKNIGSMLSPAAEERVKEAIAAARAAARQIVKAGEAGAFEIDEATIRTMRSARTAFLDLDESAQVQAPEAAVRAIDLAPEGEEPTKPKIKRERLVEIEIEA